MIVPPLTWDANGRKDNFIQWCCDPAIGFALRNAGGGVVFLQLQNNKIEKLFALLEKVFKLLKAQKISKKAKKANYSEISPRRRRSHTFPPATTTLPCEGDDMDLVTEEMNTLTVEGPNSFGRSKCQRSLFDYASDRTREPSLDQCDAAHCRGFCCDGECEAPSGT